MAGYSARQSSYTTGDTIQAADSNDEFDALLAAFNSSTGHSHDGTAGEGAPIAIADTTGTLAVARGGTGSTTASDALTALGFSAFVKTLADDADAAAFLATLGLTEALDQISVQTFTANGTYTKPSNLVAALVFVTGGGGGGGGINAQFAARAGGGGASGGTAIELLQAADIGATETVTIGAGGTAGSTAGGDGTSGGTSSFGSLCSATGGNYGYGGAGGYAAAGNSAGSGSGGTINLSGEGGGLPNSTGPYSGGGGGSFWGGGGGPVAANSGGNGGGNYGGGGGGAAGTSGDSTGRAGGAGAAGFVFVIEFRKVG